MIKATFKKEYYTKAGSLVVTSLFVAIVFLQPSHKLSSSPEVAFADPSLKSGLNIIPASCPSAGAPFLTSDKKGYAIQSRNSGVGVGVVGTGYESYCAGNSGGNNTIFIPAKTAAELNAFVTHLPPGASVQSPSVFDVGPTPGPSPAPF